MYLVIEISNTRCSGCKGLHHTSKYYFRFILGQGDEIFPIFLQESMNLKRCATFSSLFMSVSMFEMVILCMMMSVIRLSSDSHLVLAVRLR